MFSAHIVGFYWVPRQLIRLNWFCLLWSGPNSYLMGWKISRIWYEKSKFLFLYRCHCRQFHSLIKHEAKKLLHVVLVDCWSQAATDFTSAFHLSKASLFSQKLSSSFFIITMIWCLLSTPSFPTRECSSSDWFRVNGSLQTWSSYSGNTSSLSLIMPSPSLSSNVVQYSHKAKNRDLNPHW